MNLYEDIDDELLLLIASAMQLHPIDNVREDDDNMLTAAAAVVVKRAQLCSPFAFEESPLAFCWFGGGAGTKGVCRLGNNT